MSPAYVYISMYMMALMGVIGVAIWQLSARTDAMAWWGVLIAAGVPMGFSMRVFPTSVASIGDSLWWIPGAGIVGVAWAIAVDGPGAAAATAGSVGIPLAFLYTHWYSHFGKRDSAALTPGSTLPALKFEDTDGKIVRSDELTSQPALWLFYRGNWCPLCMAQVREIAAQYRDLAARGVAVHRVSPQSQEHTRDLTQRSEVPMRFLADRDNRAAARLGVLAADGLPMGMHALGYDSDVPMLTVFITAAGGRVVYSDLTENYRIRPEPAEFIAAMDRAGL